ncbi:MAG: phosphoglycerate kinase [Rhizobiaceae bacterium]
MSNLPQIDFGSLAGKRVLVRADLNVPMQGVEITDTTRIDRFLPTVKALSEAGAIVVILTHLGRPDGAVNPALSTAPIAAAMGSMLGRDVRFVTECVGEMAQQAVGDLRKGDVAVLENIRFHKGETDNDAEFAEQLAELGDIYMNDAFSCSHRAHASTHAIAKILPSYAGPSLLAEVNALSDALETPQRPVAALVGGAKVSTKITVLVNLIPKVNYLIIGGGMANTFLAAKGYPMGKSLYEPDSIDTANEVMAMAEKQACELVLPVDLVVSKEFAANAENHVVAADKNPDDAMALDVGPESQAKVIEVLHKCKTLLWNGPMGAFEIEPFGEATFAVAKSAAELTDAGKLITVAGGGDTVAALNAAGATERFTYVSTAGGAFLEWLEGKELPGIAVLSPKNT